MISGSTCDDVKWNRYGAQGVLRRDAVAIEFLVLKKVVGAVIELLELLSDNHLAIVFKALHGSTCREVSKVCFNTCGVVKIWVAVYPVLF